MHVISKLYIDTPIIDEAIGVDICRVRCTSHLYHPKSDYAPKVVIESYLLMTVEEQQQLAHHVSTARVMTLIYPSCKSHDLATDFYFKLKAREGHDDFIRKTNESLDVARRKILSKHRPLNESEQTELEHFRSIMNSPLLRKPSKKRNAPG